MRERPTLPADGYKACSLCREFRPQSSFYKRHARCKECFGKIRAAKAAAMSPEQREKLRLYAVARYRTEHGKTVLDRAKRKYLYGLTAEAYAQLMLSQGSACAACRVPFGPDAKDVVDHDHSTGKVRGLLCRGCNTALGHAKDSPQVLRQLAVYLESTEQQS